MSIFQFQHHLRPYLAHNYFIQHQKQLLSNFITDQLEQIINCLIKYQYYISMHWSQLILNLFFYEKGCLEYELWSFWIESSLLIFCCDFIKFIIWTNIYSYDLFKLLIYLIFKLKTVTFSLFLLLSCSTWILWSILNSMWRDIMFTKNNLIKISNYVY